MILLLLLLCWLPLLEAWMMDFAVFLDGSLMEMG